MQNIEKTDPAMELSALLGTILPIPASNKPTWLTLSKVLGLNPEDEEYSDFLSAVLARISGLRSIAMSAKGSQRLMDRAAGVMSTADRLAHVFLPAGQAAPWSDSLGRLSVADAINLANFSPEARAARPLRLVEPEERERFLDQVREAVEDIGTDANEIDPWFRAALLREVKRLETIIRHIDYFGHEFAAEHAAVLLTKTYEAAARAPESGRKRLTKVYRLAMDLASAFIIVHDVSEAKDTYLQWGNDLMSGFISHMERPGGESAPGNALVPNAVSPPPIAELGKA